MGWKRKDLISMQDVEAAEIRDVLDTAESMREIATREIKKVPTLRGKTVVNLFYEASTRTRTSFEIAGKWLSADVVNFRRPAPAPRGREPARHRQNIRGDEPGRGRRPAQGPGGAGARAPARVRGGQRRRRRPRAPTQALLDLLTIRQKGHLKASTSRSSATSPTAASRARTFTPCERWG
jgi:aspartate carbamoyltransferase catalytic subunit